MSQGPIAPDFGIIAPILAAAACHSGSPLSTAGSGQAVLGNKTSGNSVVIALALHPRTIGEIVPAQFAGPLTLSEAQWNAITDINGVASAVGLVPGSVYVQWTSGKLNTGSGFVSVGDILWVVGIALTSTTMLICPRAHAVAN